MADSHSLPVQSKSPRTSIQGSTNKEDDDDSETKLPLELVEPSPRAPPKIDINALKNEILTDGMQVGAIQQRTSYIAIYIAIQLVHAVSECVLLYSYIATHCCYSISSHRAL